MNSLIFLTEEDFSIQQGKKGYIMCNNIPGVSLVLFFGNRCDHCPPVKDAFNYLPRAVQGCQFALVNLSTNVNIAYMSKKTIAPIEHVPFIILYVNGRPFMKYNGDKTVQALANFVIEVLSRLQSKKNFTNNTKVEHGDADIPEYASGIPFNMVCEGEQCYLTFSEAYNKQR
jgi:hypothetical protein